MLPIQDSIAYGEKKWCALCLTIVHFFGANAR